MILLDMVDWCEVVQS